jgi:PBSX family phage terminase large subunit
MRTTKAVMSSFHFQPFSRKQKQVFTWWLPNSPHKDKDAIICDGSVRSGKTLAMSLSFVMWATETFDGENLAFCGKTIASLRRNVIIPLLRGLRSRGYHAEEHLTNNSITISRLGRTNEFYLFGGRDERSQDLIQGVTLAGTLFDEVALMPESFVNQATARCSVEGSKYWLNCNPAGPYHWFKENWIDQAKEKNALHLHFTMEDNLSLSEKVKARYRSLYSGVFFQRYILGLWVMAEGVIYDMWDVVLNTFDDSDVSAATWLQSQRYIAVDYGTQNPMVFLDIWDDGETVWVRNEYYYDGRATGHQKEDSEYADDLQKFVGTVYPRYLIIDPSAASFKIAAKRRGYRVKDADNDVLDGIRSVATLMSRRKIRVHRHNCPNLLKERASYVWDEKAAQRGIEQPLKQTDHSMDALRYFVFTMLRKHRIYG